MKSKKEATNENGLLTFKIKDDELKKLITADCWIMELTGSEIDEKGDMQILRLGEFLQIVSFSIDGKIIKEYEFKPGEYIKDNPNNIRKLYFTGTAIKKSDPLRKRIKVPTSLDTKDAKYILEYLDINNVKIKEIEKLLTFYLTNKEEVINFIDKGNK